MRKSKLIELLNAIEGNPEIVLWNGFVGDYQHIDSKFVPVDLVKQTFDDWKWCCETQKQFRTKDLTATLSEDEIAEMRERYKGFQYEENHYVTQEDISAGRYKKKRVVMIQAKARGISTSDRLGNMEY